MHYAQSLITLLQALQLVALAPCVFVIAFLLVNARDYRAILVPCLYFSALAASFLLPLFTLWPDWSMGQIYRSLIFIQSLLPALSFLLIIQFATAQMPRASYWLILALPLIGGSGVVYASLLADEVCLQGWGCLPSSDVEGLYSTFSTAFIFLLLMAVFARTRRQRSKSHDRIRHRNEYWLIVALIGLNLCLLAVGLLRIEGTLKSTEALFITTIFRISFIYVVLTLLFRVFDHGRRPVEQTREAAAPSPEQEQRDRDLIAAFEALLQEQHIYREMGCNREAVARQLGVNENTLSRVVNQHYQVRFTDVLNQYRVKEAQTLLLAEKDMPVTDIAFEVGFNSIPSFNRVFKETTGFSPTAFRKSREPRNKA